MNEDQIEFWEQMCSETFRKPKDVWDSVSPEEFSRVLIHLPKTLAVKYDISGRWLHWALGVKVPYQLWAWQKITNPEKVVGLKNHEMRSGNHMLTPESALNAACGNATKKSARVVVDIARILSDDFRGRDFVELMSEAHQWCEDSRKLAAMVGE